MLVIFLTRCPPQGNTLALSGVILLGSVGWQKDATLLASCGEPPPRLAFPLVARALEITKIYLSSEGITYSNMKAILIRHRI